jgi:hypothetical protein
VSGVIAPPFMTPAATAALPPWKQPPVPITQEHVWAPEPTWELWSTEKSLESRRMAIT